MCPDRTFRPRAQRGFALATAIFLLVVLAALGAAMLTFSSTQHTGSAMDVQGARALQAARAGIEWGAYQALRNNSCASSTTVATPPPVNPLAGTLSGFTLVVECSSTSSGALTVYHITSTASAGTAGQISRVERELKATISP